MTAEMTPDEVRAAVRANADKRVRPTYSDGVIELVDLHGGGDDEGFLHSGPDGIDPTHWWTRFDSVVRVEPVTATQD